MDLKNKVIVSEYVSCGHPDKVADQISDALLGMYLREDENSRCGIETMVKDNIVVIGGEVHSDAMFNIDWCVKWVFDKIGYPKNHGLSMDKIKVINLLGQQSNEIHQGVDKTDGEIGAGDQGFMVGFASNETEVFMPLGHYVARVVCQHISGLDKLGIGPDAKSQTVVEYDSEGVGHVKQILVSAMHQNSIAELRDIVDSAIRSNKVGFSEEVYEKYIKDAVIDIVVNPCGEWRIGGSVSDCGVTGRKIVVDHYGGYSNVGGGAFSGKDMTKVDRSGAYMARYLAKNIVAAGIADMCKVELSYMIGVAQPSSINIELNRNDELVDDIVKWIYENVDMTPKGIINRFKIWWGDYEMYACEGHFGFREYVEPFDDDDERDSLSIRPWELTDISDQLRERFAV